MVLTRESLQAWLRLSLTPGVGNISARALLKAFGLPEHIFQSSASELKAFVSPAMCQQLLTRPRELDEAVETTWAWLNTPAVARKSLHGDIIGSGSGSSYGYGSSYGSHS